MTLSDDRVADGHPTLRDAVPGAVLLPVRLCQPNPWNRKIDEKRLAEMGETIKRHGVMQPIIVRPAPDAKPGSPTHEIVAGERRWRASLLAEVPTIPVVVRHLTDLEVIELMLIENLQREGLHELDEAEGYDRLLRKENGLQGFATVDALCEHFKKSRSYVFQRLKLLQLCAEAKKAFREGAIEFGHARALAPVADPKRQAQALKEIIRGWGGSRMSVRDAERHVQSQYTLELAKATFKIADATLVPEDRKSTRLNSSHIPLSRMPSSA